MVPTDEKGKDGFRPSPRQENIELDRIYIQQFVLVKDQRKLLSWDSASCPNLTVERVATIGPASFPEIQRNRRQQTFEHIAVEFQPW